MTENLARLGVRTELATLVGDDESGRSIVTHLRDLGVDTRHVRLLPEQTTAEYVAVLEPDGALTLGLADMGIFNLFTSGDVVPLMRERNGGWIFADCNLPPEVLSALIARSDRSAFRLAVDAVSVAKARRLPADLSGIDLLVLNRYEAAACLGAGPASASENASALLSRGAARVIVTCGAEGIVTASNDAVAWIPAVPAQAVDVTGAGDALVAATLFGLSQGHTLAASARLGTLVAALTIEAPTSVRGDLSPELLKSAMHRLEPLSA